VGSYPRPHDPTVAVAKESVEGTCPECGADSLARYPVLAEGGWFQVVKCQNCLHSVSRDRWSRLGDIALLSDTL
jgi:hypothetical protein